MENDERSFEEQSVEKAGKATVGEKILEPTRIENNHTELFIDGPDTLAMLLREIKKAQHFIHVQVMLFYSDEAGFRIADALAAKAAEGVEVRVMSDSEMSSIVRPWRNSDPRSARIFLT